MSIINCVGHLIEDIEVFSVISMLILLVSYEDSEIRGIEEGLAVFCI